MARRGYPTEFRRRVIELVEGGRKVSEIAAKFEMSEQFVGSSRRLRRERQFESGLVLHTIINPVSYFAWRGCCVFGLVQRPKQSDLKQRH